MLVHAYAKINLSLRVLGKRPDSYHDIDSIMQTISLHDTLDIDLTDRAGEIQLSVQMHDPGSPTVPADTTNLCYKAAQRFLTTSGIDRGVSIKLVKMIPSQAGLGGGSSDAAAVLRTLNTLAGGILSHQELTKIAASLGADVPFFLTGGTCRVTGIGEVVEALDDHPPLGLLIVKPSLGVSTPKAYAAIDRSRDTASWTTPENIGELYINDFEAVVYEANPELRIVRNILLGLKCDTVMLCGSGSAIAAISSVETIREGLTKSYEFYTGVFHKATGKSSIAALYPGTSMSQYHLRNSEDWSE